MKSLRGGSELKELILQSSIRRAEGDTGHELRHGAELIGL
jgi:hypothetical protein